MFGKFGNMFGDMKEKQEAMRSKLQETTIAVKSPNAEITITVNAVREVVDISIDPEWAQENDTEAIEDVLVNTLNEALAQAAETEAKETEKLLKDMLPPGLGGLKGMFG